MLAGDELLSRESNRIASVSRSGKATMVLFPRGFSPIVLIYAKML
jgi:hypothetical protein